MSSDFPFSVRSRNFCFFSVSAGGRGLCFCCIFCPHSREGNFGLHSTRFNYSSSYKYGSRADIRSQHESRQLPHPPTFGKSLLCWRSLRTRDAPHHAKTRMKTITPNPENTLVVPFVISWSQEFIQEYKVNSQEAYSQKGHQRRTVYLPTTGLRVATGIEKFLVTQ